MNHDTIEGNWKQFKGKILEQWGKLTDDDLEVMQGRHEILVGRIQERHGIDRETAVKQVAEWQKHNPTFVFEKSQ